MALDIGGRRIGVALSDTLRLLANPLLTITVESRRLAIEQIVRLIATHQVTALVVGLPLTLNGEVGPQAEKVRKFVAELQPQLTIPIYESDERLTSVEAERMLSEQGVKPQDRRRRLDEIAAALILRDWLDVYAPPRRFLSEDE
jgi:putative Holliday junction resolvase